MTQRHAGAYWNSYYRSERVPELPSQFALFVANEVATGELTVPRAIIDLGCGNGRDSLLFAQLGHRVGCIDLSDAAIAASEARFERAGLGASQRPVCRIGKSDGEALGLLAAELGGPILVYSRFFFHAIDDDAEARTIERIGEVLGQYGGSFAAEFRTLGDAERQKTTSAHFRRFVDPARYCERLERCGLTIIWQAEGCGMAKYRQDDALVARIVAKA